ncbi:MAG: hypothetical protein E6I95_06240 [Chloroflexi bacterium]|nr:MAG: hypothetical protein E6I95_06240 [Chloroflexota bacterium]
MLATVGSCVLAGLEARRVEVQADSANGEAKFALVGLAATSVKEVFLFSPMLPGTSTAGAALRPSGPTCG